MDDRCWMLHALELAERGRGYVEPNPLVGAVVVRDGRIVGTGWHQRYGEAHAEVHALAEAGAAAQGATLFVTLEPCCHQGKTPPCTAAVIRAGIARVVAAMPDPFPQVAGQGFAELEAAGIAVESGLCAVEARRLNAPYLKLLSTGRPYVHAKWAMTLDGKIATRTGDSKWISGAEARRLVHQLRGRMDAIIVGVGTVIADDPLLTARPPGPRVPVRVVLDSRGRVPLASQLVQTAAVAPTLIAVREIALDKKSALLASGCEVLLVESGGEHVDLGALLSELGRRRMTNVLVEGGSRVFGSLVAADAADEYHVFIAPRLAGGHAAPSPVGGPGVEKMADALPLARWQMERIGEDLYVHAWRSWEE